MTCISGAVAHQSYTVQTHSNVLSVQFYEGDRRVISGHVHMNGAIDYSSRTVGGESWKWTPTREEVNQVNWIIYDLNKKKTRNVHIDGNWWYIEKGAEKVYF